MIQQYIKKHKQDGILFKTAYLFQEAGDDVNLRAKALKEVAYTVSMLNNAIVEEEYLRRLSKFTKISFKIIADEVKAERTRREEATKPKKKAFGDDMPDWVNEDNWRIHGFDAHINGKATGFYFADGYGAERITNFALTPIVHVYSDTPENNVRVTELSNGIDTMVIDMPTKAFLSALDFENTVGGFGNFVTMNSFSKGHLNRLKVKLWNDYPTCHELQTLGWQTEGFFAWSNRIYKDGLRKFNEYGVVTVDDVNYISKSASVKKVILRGDSDPYENDKYLKYVETELTFKNWCNAMQGTYGMTGNIGAAFALLSLFRDVVFKVDNNCPMLYAYGEAQSGKSKFAESVSNLFFNEMPAFNLNQGTDVAFWNRLMRFRNCPVMFNEFDENAIKDEWFRALKAVYDGEGRERGTIKKGKSDVQKVNCTVILMGQYLSTKDDNSVLSRCIPQAFKKQNERKPEVLKAYDELKAMEKAGLSGILPELLQHRELVKDRYAVVFGEVKTEMLKALREASIIGETRIVGNYSHVLAMCKLLSPLIGFGINYREFFTYCYNEIVKLSQMMSESNALSDFWNSIERLMDTGILEYGYDFKIENQPHVTKMDGRTSTMTHHFEEPTEVLYMRLNSVHTEYMKLKRSSTGKNGINMQTIDMYMKDQPYYVGICKSSSFRSAKLNKKMNTSCIMLKYNPLTQANLYREYDGHKAVTDAGDKKAEDDVDNKPTKDTLPF